MERLGSLFWSGVMTMALLGMLGSIAAPAVLAGPTVRITEPGHGQVVQGQIVIDVAYRTDSDQPITRIDLLIDDQLVRQYSLATPRLHGTQSFRWDFTSQPGGTYTISARAVDQAGAIGSATISVTVTGAQTRAPGTVDRIPPVINIYYPAHGATVSGEVEIKAEAQDNVGVKYVFFYINGKVHKIIMNAPPWVDRWDTTRVPDGTYVLQAKAMDEAENVGRSAEVTVFVQNRDMTLADPAALEQQVPSVSHEQTPAAPPVGDRPQVTERDFNAQQEQPTLMAASVDIEARRSEVGYVSSIRDDDARARMSVPRHLAALPRTEPPAPASLAIDESLIQLPAVAGSEDAAQEPRIAAIDAPPRMTIPRHLPEIGRHVIAPISEGTAVERPIEPSLALAETMQRLTRPRTEMDAPPATESMVSMQAGRLVLEPALQLRPDHDTYDVARTTAPLRTLLPTETLAPDLATLDALVLDAEPMSHVGTIVATLEARTTLPSRTISAEEQVAFAAPVIDAVHSPSSPIAAMLEVSEPAARTTLPPYAPEMAPLAGSQARHDRAEGMRIAVLPERASRAMIPADGRMTRPGEPLIAPVASSSFQDIEILFNNKTLDLLTAPEMKQGISLAPLREIFEASDGVLYWYPVEKKVRATRPGTDMRITIGDPEVMINDASRTLQVAPYIKHGRTMVPLQFLADTLDVTVTFNPDTGQIAITSNEF